MSTDLLQTILDVETKANKIILSAEEEKKSIINQAKLKAAQIIAEAKKEAKFIIEDIILKAQEQAIEEKKEIEKETHKKLEEIRAKAKKNIEKAKKIWQ